MKQKLGAGLLLTVLVGCNTAPTKPAQPEGTTRIAANAPDVIASTMADYYRAREEKKLRAEAPRVLTKLTIGEVLDRYVPADFQVFSAGDVDLETLIDYETSRPWTEALGKPLLDAGVEMTANLERKTMSLRAGVTTIGLVLNRFVPADFTVYTDESVNLDTQIKFDRSIPWMRALGVSLAYVEVNAIINVDKRIVVLKSKRPPIVIRAAQSATVGQTNAPARRQIQPLVDPLYTSER